MVAQPRAMDVILAISSYTDENRESRRRVERFETPAHVHGDVWIGDLDREFADSILAECSARGEHYSGFPTYAFYRELPEGDHGYSTGFDPDLRLRIALYLSRLVHPTATGLEAAARVRYKDDGTPDIRPHVPHDQNRFAFVARPSENWLVPSDIPALTDLLTAYHATTLPSRVSRALWFHEAVFRQYYAELRWTLLVTALEALVHVRDERLPSGKWPGTRKVFTDRLMHLGTLDAALVIAEQKLHDFYEERSVVAHGARSRRDNRAAPETLYEELEDFARRVLRKAVLEPEFGACFASDKEIQARLPLRPMKPQ